MFPLPELTPEQIQAIIPFIFVGFLAQLVDGAEQSASRNRQVVTTQTN